MGPGSPALPSSIASVPDSATSTPIAAPQLMSILPVMMIMEMPIAATAM